MTSVTPAQLLHLRTYLAQISPRHALQPELVDHLACEVEQLMAKGHTFEAAFSTITQEVSGQVIIQLKQNYQREIDIPNQLLAIAAARRQRRRRAYPKQFRYMLLSSVLAFVLFLLCLTFASRPFAVPLHTFNGAWLAGLVSVSGAVATHWLLRRQSRKGRAKWA